MKDHVSKMECGRIQDWAYQFLISLGRKLDLAILKLYTALATHHTAALNSVNF